MVRLTTTLSLLLVCAALLFANSEPSIGAASATPPANRPLAEPFDDFATSDTCQSCHPSEHESWRSSYHSSMTQVIDGDLDVRIEPGDLWVAGSRYRFSRRADATWVEMEDPDNPGTRIERQIVMSTGSHHMQVLWYDSLDSRRLGQLPIVYLFADDLWIPRSAAFIRPPQHGSGSETGRWNLVCIQCHVTQGRPRPLEDGSWDSRAAEFGIGCESCHGPASEHVARNRNPLRRYGLHFGAGDDPTVVQPAQLDHRRSSEVCGQCHSNYVVFEEELFHAWLDDGFPYRAGERLAETKTVVRGRPSDNPDALVKQLEAIPEYFRESYWPDGTVRVSGREYNGLRDSACFSEGELSCLSCHSMHPEGEDLSPWADDQLHEDMRGDAACVGCHASYAAADALEAHTHHSPASAGSRCMNCHMPHATYGLLKAMRNHTIDSPAVTSAAASGRPNACNQCHLDQSLGWTAEHLTRWYRRPVPQLTEDERDISATLLWALRGDAGQRALAAWTLGWDDARRASGEDWIPAALAPLLEDPYHAVRLVAWRSLRSLDGYDDLEWDESAPMNGRSELRRAVMERYALHPARRLPDGVAELLGANASGSARYQRLLAQRDRRPLLLAE